MKTFETLYKRTRTGAIQFWSIKAEAGNIEKVSGQLGTLNPIKHYESCVGVNIGRSNETTPEQQAELQAESDWKKKKDSGYKSLQDLGIGGEGDSDLDKTWYIVDGLKVAKTKLPEILEAKLPQFNSDASGNLLPMLAPSKLWAPSPKNRYPVGWEIKYDGNRTTLVMDLEETYALTRTGKPHTQLQHLCGRS